VFISYVGSVFAEDTICDRDIEAG